MSSNSSKLNVSLIVNTLLGVIVASLLVAWAFSASGQHSPYGPLHVPTTDVVQVSKLSVVEYPDSGVPRSHNTFVLWYGNGNARIVPADMLAECFEKDRVGVFILSD